MKIFYVHHNSDLYGASRSLVRLIEHLDRSKFSPVVLLGEDGPLRESLEKAKAEVIICKHLSIITRPVFKSWRIIPFIFNFPRSVRILRKLIKQHRIDLVHTNTGVITASALAAKLAGVPHVWHIRDWFGEFSLLWKPYANYMLWASKKIIAVSKAMAHQFPESDKVCVVNNGFSLKEFTVPKDHLRAVFREQFRLGEGLVIGCVGRIKLVRKGQEVLIKAAKILKDRNVSVRILIIGSPYSGNESHLEELKRMVDQLELQSTVVFTGEMKDPRPAYAAMDIFVLPSSQPEPFGGVVMEAMAMGIPVIATNIGGSVEQVAEGSTGFLVPPNDPESLAEKLEMLLTDSALRRRMSEAGPKRIEEKFSLAEMAQTIQSIYLQCFAERK